MAEAPERRVYAFIPNDDTAVSALLLEIVVNDEVAESLWRIDGSWEPLEEAEERSLFRSSMQYAVHDFAQTRILQLFDDGFDVDASLIECAMRDSDELLVYYRLGYTKDICPKLLSARERRELEPSALTEWLRAFIAQEIQATAAEAFSALLEILADHAAKRPVVLKSLEAPSADFRLPSDWQQQLLNDDLDEGWSALHRFISALILLTNDVVVVSVDAEHYDDEVYVQMCREDEGWVHVEAASSAHVEPPLSADAITTLHELGWEDPVDGELPNYFQQIPPDRASPGEVARLLVDTLRRVYRTEPDDLHKFEPRALVRSMLAGDFGPDVAVNPSLGAGARGRLFLGIRFPQHIGLGNAGPELTSVVIGSDPSGGRIGDATENEGEGEVADVGQPDWAIREGEFPHIEAVIGPLDQGVRFMAEQGAVGPDGQRLLGCWVTSLPGRTGLRLVDELLRSGAQWVSGSDGVESLLRDRDVRRWVRLKAEGQEFYVVEDTQRDPGTYLWARLGAFPRTIEVLEALAAIPFDPGLRLIQEEQPDDDERRFTVWSGWTPGASADVSSALEWAADAMVSGQRLHEAEMAPIHGDAFEDLTSAFVRQGLGVPWIPQSFRRELRRSQDWGWTTEVDPDYMQDYLFQADLDGPVPDLVTVGHAGHGINSYALTWRMAIGPLVFMAQVGWGGAYGDASRDVGRQAEIFHRVSQVVQHLSHSHPDFTLTPRMRRYQWLVSDIRNINVIRQWDGRSMSWIEIEPASDIVDTFVMDLPE